MKFTPIDPPRVFSVGHDHAIQLKDCARLELKPDEQVTFLTESGAEYDVVRKAWGFYATPSLNRRLPKFGLRAALVKSADGTFYVMLVEQGKQTEFQRYLEQEHLQVVRWLDSGPVLEALAREAEAR